jgi:hypothetical protein
MSQYDVTKTRELVLRPQHYYQFGRDSHVTARLSLDGDFGRVVIEHEGTTLTLPLGRAMWLRGALNKVAAFRNE